MVEDGDVKYLSFPPGDAYIFMRGETIDHLGVRRIVWLNHSPADDGTTSLYFYWWFLDDVTQRSGLVGMLLNLADGTMTISPQGADTTRVQWPMTP